MRNEESNEASFAEREDIVGGADAASEKAAIMAVPKEHEGAATGTASRKPARSTLAIFSYILSASAVVAAFGFLLAVGLSGRYSSVAQESSVAQIRRSRKTRQPNPRQLPRARSKAPRRRCRWRVSSPPQPRLPHPPRPCRC